MKKLLFLFCALPLVVTAQVFTKIDASVTGKTQGVNRPIQTLKTQEGHIWFNSLVASRYRLYEYDGSTYTYHDQFFDSTVSANRDISATHFAQAKDGTIYTQGGQFYRNGVWRKTPFSQEYFAQSQDGNTLYFNRNSDSLFSLTNGVMTKHNIALNQIPGIAQGFGSNYKDAVADNQGNLYFATQDTGVVKINAASGVVTYMPIYYSGIFLADARALHVASNGNLYVGSGGDYMAYHNGTKWTVMINMQPWDFGMGRIDDFAEDSHGRVWVGSRTGSLAGFLGRFDEADTTRLYDIIWDTTSNHQFISDRNIEAILIDNDSTFYFGVYQENYLLRVGVKNTISLNEHGQVKALTAYPNPVSDRLWLDGINEGQAEVYTLNGKLVAVPKIENGSLTTGNLPPGVYLLVVQDRDLNTYQMKFVKN